MKELIEKRIEELNINVEQILIETSSIDDEWATELYRTTQMRKFYKTF